LNTNIQPNPHWIARYNDGSVIYEIDINEKQNSFFDIDKNNLLTFSMKVSNKTFILLKNGTFVLSCDHKRTILFKNNLENIFNELFEYRRASQNFNINGEKDTPKIISRSFGYRYKSQEYKCIINLVENCYDIEVSDL